MKTKHEVSSKQQTSLNDLPDFLLAEILHRLPLIFAHRSKLVCKGWYSVISEPYFSEWFSHDKKPYSLLSVCGLGEKPPTLYPDSEFESSGLAKGFSLGFIPREISHRGRNIRVETSSNDLLLCRDYSTYLVCNPVTREWTRLPRDFLPSFPIPFVGFTSKTNGEFAILTVMPNFNLHVLYSSRLVWAKTTLYCPPRIKNMKFSCRYGVSCKEFLFWLEDSSGKVAGIDAFDILSKNPNSWLLIDPPKEYICRNRGSLQDERLYSSCLETCRGNLRLCQLSRKDAILNVWDLKNTEWLLHSQVFLREIGKYTRNLIAGKDRKIECCDPNDPNVIYTTGDLLKRNVASFNLLTREIKRMPPCPSDDTRKRLIPFKLQWQPTRLLLSNNRKLDSLF